MGKMSEGLQDVRAEQVGVGVKYGGMSGDSMAWNRLILFLEAA